MDLVEFNAHRRTVQTAAGELSYTDFGNGRTVLLLHGLGVNGYLWRNVVELLREDVRCVVLDLPGHGASPIGTVRPETLGGLADVVEDFCAALELSEVDLVTNDTGGAIGQIFAVRHPERLRTLTLTNCEAHDNIPNDAFRATVELAKQGKLADLAGQMLGNLDFARSPRGLGADYEHPETLTDEEIRVFLEPVAGNRESTLHFERLLASLDPKDLLSIEPALRRLTVPTLIVWATADGHFELSWAYWLRDAIPGASEVVELPGAKLHFPVERAAEFVPHLQRHWAANTAAPSAVAGD
jgi:pimeloyl-ACP methyl ester carboxylesterase